MDSNVLTGNSKFVVGCNYWASHAGTAMWSDWKPEVVEEDLKRLSDEGLQVLRVFPLWPDFQPLNILRGGHGHIREFSHGENPLSQDEDGQAGVSKEAIKHFEEFSMLADKYGLKLIVGLITGWMSGRLFVPQGLEGRNVLTDPLSVMWQVRFVKYFVKHFINDSAIIAWDLGNECNCTGPVPNRESAWVWTSAIVNAIKSQDTSRPVVSGMHSLLPDGQWTIQDQGELTDVLTTHPYPVFTPHCDQDPVNTIRTLLHATSESRFYSDIGHKPCLVEEIGTLGPMVASESIAADFVRANLFSSWSNNCSGLLWWCGNDQINLSHAPYDWNSVERELGLLRIDGTPKPVLKELGKFKNFLAGLPFDTIPERIKDGVCIISEDQDQWGVAYSSFVLAKQAGVDIEFQYQDQPLKTSKLYLLPCITAHSVIRRRKWLELMDRVYEGAVLYISYNGGFLSQFQEITGLEVQTREQRSENVQVEMDGLYDKPYFEIKTTSRLTLKSTGAEVLGRDGEDNPVFACSNCGKGKVYFLALPLEMHMTSTPGVFHLKNAQPYWKIYRHIAASIPSCRVANKDNPFTGITEHTFDENNRLVVLTNYSPCAVETAVILKHGWKVKDTLYGKTPTAECEKYNCKIEGCNGLVFTITKSE